MQITVTFKEMNAIMNRVIAFLMALTVFLSYPDFVNVYADSELLASYSFNSYATNEIPAELGIKANGYYITEYEFQNKGLKIFTEKKGNTFPISVKTGGEVTVSFDIMRGGEPISGGLRLAGGNTEFDGLIFTKANCITLGDGNEVGGISKSIMTHVVLSLNLPKNRVSVSVNGKSKVSDYFVSCKSLSSLSGITFYFDQTQGGSVILDNINISSGLKELPSYPRDPYNSDFTDIKSFDNAEKKVFSNSDFDILNDMVWQTKSNNVAVFTEEDGNKCLRLEKKGSEDSYNKIKLSSDNYTNVVWEVDVKPIDIASKLLVTANADVKRKWSIDVIVNEGSIFASGAIVGKVSPDKWTNIALIYNFDNETYSVYIDRQLVRENIPYASPLNEELTDMNMEIPGGETSKCDMLIDNFRCYEGDALLDFEKQDYTEIWKETVSIDNDEKYKNMLSDFTAISLRSGVIYSNGEKMISDVLPYIKNSRTMVPVRALSEAMGIETEYSDAEKRVFVGGSAELTINSDIMKVNGREIKLDAAPEIRDGRTFLPMRALCESVLGKKVVYDNSAEVNSGIVIIGDNEFAIPSGSEAIQQLTNFLMYFRPSKERIYGDYIKTGYKGVHPRLMIDREGVERLKHEIKVYPEKKKIFEKTLAVADSYLTGKAPEYGLYDGTRMSSAPAARCYYFGMAYLLTGDMKYADAAWVQIEALCKFQDWNPNHYLDTSEIAAGVAIGYDWMYDAWTDEQRKIIEEALYKNGLQESALWQHGIKGSQNRWFTSGANWNIVCNCNINIAALALMDVYPELCCDLISNSYRGLEYCLGLFAPDGAWSEGISYWSYFMPYFTRWEDSCAKVLGSSYNICCTEGLSKTADYFVQLQSESGFYNYADAEASPQSYPAPLIWCSNKFNEPGLTSLYLRKGKANSDPCSLIWIKPETETDDGEMPLDGIFRGADVAVMRESWTDSNSAYLAYHGGTHGTAGIYSHNHLDGGSFIFDSMGERWAIDMGKDDYNLTGYWNQDPAVTNDYTWKIFRRRAEGHNTIIINPDGTGVDHVLDSSAPISEITSKPRGATGTVDLSGNLATDAISAKRGFILTDERKSMVVRDEIQLKKQSTIYWHMYTNAVEDEMGDDYIVLRQNGKRLRVDFACNADYSINFGHAEPMAAMPTVKGENRNVGIQRIQLIINGSGNVSITAKLTSEEITSASPVSQYDTSINSWTIPDGELIPAPTVDMIYANGEPINGFNKYTKSYVIQYIEGETAAPTFTADAGGNGIEIISSGDYTEPAIIRVTDPVNPDNTTVYSINYVEIPKPVEFDNIITFAPVAINASAEPQPENNKNNVIDNNFETRWSAEGKTGDCFIEFDLGKKTDVDTVLMATYNGDKRSLYFDIAVSGDGADFTTVYSGMTGGHTNDYEQYDFAKCNARYVRIICYGTSEAGGTWNSITELMVGLKK